jgi:hypothetical protein
MKGIIGPPLQALLHVQKYVVPWFKFGTHQALDKQTNKAQAKEAVAHFASVWYRELLY